MEKNLRQLGFEPRTSGLMFIVFVVRTSFKGLTLAPGREISAIVCAAALPKTTTSRRELAPRRLAPWTETQAHSPQA